MSTFPRLKTGAVLQYPAERSLNNRVRVLPFVDGGEQRYPLSDKPRRRWVINLELLDDQEASRVDRFVKTQAALGEVFEFEDPWDGTLHKNCRVGGAGMELQCYGPNRNRLRIQIEEDPE
jgi:hypothetical protein